MQEQGNTVRMHVTQGSGEPAQMHFTPGEKVGPTSVGASAEWRVSATAVLPVHAYVYYDGTQLFVRSATDSSRVTVDGRGVGEDWQALQVPCAVRMGLAVLCVSAETDDKVDTSDSDETQQIVPLLAANVVRRGSAAAEPPAPAKPIAATATSVLPVEVMMAARQTARQASKRARFTGAPPPSPAPAADGSPIDGKKTLLSPVVSREASQAELTPQDALKRTPAVPAARQTPTDAAPPSTAMPSAAIAGKPAGPPPPAVPSFGKRSPAMLPVQEAPRPALPLEVVAGLAPPAPSDAFQATPQGLQPAPISPANVGAGSGSTSSSRLLWLKRHWSSSSNAKKAAVMLALPAALLLGVMLMKGATRRSTTGAAPTPASTVSAASEGVRSTSSATSAPASAAPSSSGPAAVASTSARPIIRAAPGNTSALSARAAKQKTPQRRAVDAVAAGSYEEAAQIYEELAQSNPEEPAYVEAARILRAKRPKP